MLGVKEKSCDCAMMPGGQFLTCQSWKDWNAFPKDPPTTTTTSYSNVMNLLLFCTRQVVVFCLDFKCLPPRYSYQIWTLTASNFLSQQRKGFFLLYRNFLAKQASYPTNL